MNNGIWVSPNQFVQFAEKNDRLTDHIVTRDRSPDFSALGSYLPNPDPILRAKGKVLRSTATCAAILQLAVQSVDVKRQ